MTEAKLEFQKWKDAGMIYNRYNKVVCYLDLMEKVDGSLDIDSIRYILKELIKVSNPVEPCELEVMRLIRG